MSCPYNYSLPNGSPRYLRQSSDGNLKVKNTSFSYSRQKSTSSVSNHSEHNGEILQVTPTIDVVEDSSTTSKEPLNYTTYLRLPGVLDSVHCLSHVNPSDETSPPIHDEHFFIIIHQIFELWFKAFLYEIDSIREIFNNSSQVVPLLFYINLRLTRSVGIWNMLIEMLQGLETMTPVEFLAFRDYVTPASGFQSLQFRIIEMRLGLTDNFRQSYKTEYFTKTMFKGEQSRELKKVVEEESLLTLLERWLEYIYDSTTSFQFLEVYASAVGNFIQHTKEQKLANSVDVATVERETETMRRQFNSVIDEEEYQKLRDSEERRISHKAMLAALMISLYHQQQCFQQSYQMLNLLMDIDTLIASWRHKHVLLVLRQIGRKPGSGGTGGFSYLHKTVSEKYQIFVDLFNVSSYLIPQRFLPTFFGQLSEPANLLSSLYLKPSPQVPVIRRSNPTNQSSSITIPYNQNALFLLLFFGGVLFNALILGVFSLSK